MVKPLRLWMAGVLGCLFIGSAASQPYPRKAVTMILPNAPGGAFDAAARPLAQALSQSLGQAVVVDNRPAAGGIVGAQAAARATPDGHTIIFTGSAQISVFPFLRKDLPYKPERDFAPISRLGFLDSFLMVHPTMTVNSLRELLDLARSKPDSITFGTWGPTSASNMYIEWLKRARNISLLADHNYTDKALTALGYLADEPGTPESFAEFLKSDRKTYDDLVKLTGIKDE